MGLRLELQDLLEEILGSENVYFQPPSSVSMKYPAIVYNLDDIKADFADNSPYNRTKRYQVTHISRDPDDPTPDKMSALPMCTFSTHFVVNGLNHNVFNLYF